MAPALKVSLTSTSIQVVYSGGPGNAADWVALYISGKKPGLDRHLAKKYVNNSGLNAYTSGTLEFPYGADTFDHDLVVYFFANNTRMTD